MALLISQNPEAQEKIIQGLVFAMTEFSSDARKCFRLKLEQLAHFNSSDVVICGYYHDPNQPEFSLAWFNNGTGNSNIHPHESDQTPYMVGGLVFHSFNDSWGIHT